MKKLKLVLLLLLIKSGAIFAQTTSGTPVTIPSSEKLTIQSSSVGAEFNIYVHFPDGYEKSDKKLPVLYVVDGDNDFAPTIEYLGLLKAEYGITEPLLVAIGNGGMIGTPGNKRFRDFTPSAIPQVAESGGAEKFLKFIETELIPLIDSKYKADPAERTIYGYSLGGLFTSYVLFQKPQLFKNILMGSPALAYDNEKIAQLEEEYSKRSKSLPVKIFFEVGELEGPQQINPVEKLVKKMKSRNYQGLEMKSIILKDLTHLSGKPDAMFEALEFAYAKPKVK